MVSNFIFATLFLFPILLLGLAGRIYIKLKDFQLTHTNTLDNKIVVELCRIGNSIRESGFACLIGQYQYLFFVIPVLLTSSYLFFNVTTTLGFLLGLLSALSIVYFSLDVATTGNVTAALGSMAENGLKNSFEGAFSAGRCIGTFISGQMVLFLIIFFILKKFNLEYIKFALGTAAGGSLIALFARLSGGVFTKSADISGDLVGKILLDLPEDSPSNPAVIADNVGDNIGDCVGTATDIFETFLSSCLLALVFGNNPTFLIAIFSSITASIVSIFTIRFSGASNLGKFDAESKIARFMSNIFQRSILISPLIFFVLNYLFSANLFDFVKDFLSFLFGSCSFISLLSLNMYYTSASGYPVRKISEASRNGAAMNVITGLSLSLEATFTISFAICMISGLCYFINGTRGIIISLFSLLGFIPSVMTMDSYGPIVDNAGGLVVMSNAPKQARYVTDILDALGNLTKSLTKAYSSGISTITCIVLMKVIIDKAASIEMNALTVIGGFIGSGVVYLFSGIVISAVYKGAEYMTKIVVFKLKNQDPNTTDYHTGSIKSLGIKSVQYSLPAMLVAILPVVIFMTTRSLNLFKDSSLKLILGFLFGASFSGLSLSQLMTIAGAAWDNVKKRIEASTEEEEEEINSRINEKLISMETSEVSYAKPHYDVDSLTSILSKVDNLKNISPDTPAVISDIKEELKAYMNSIRIKQKVIDVDYGMIMDNLRKIDLRKCISILENKENDENPKDTSNNENIFEIFKDLRKKFDIKRFKDAAVTGDIIGDPLKDSSGVALNSLVKFFIIYAMLAIWNMG